MIGITFAATPTTHSAFAYKKRGGDRKDKGNDYGTYNANGNGNTVTVQVNKQNGKQSGHDNTFEQQAQNVICTHPSTTCTGGHSHPPG